MSLLTLKEWAKQKYSKPPSIYTLRRWAKDGRIQPPPQKHGREWQVKHTAKYYNLNTGESG